MKISNLIVLLTFISCSALEKGRRSISSTEGREITEKSEFFEHLERCDWADLNENRWMKGKYLSRMSYTSLNKKNKSGDYLGTIELFNEYKNPVFYWGTDLPNKGTQRRFNIDESLKTGQTEIHFGDPIEGLDPSVNIQPSLLRSIKMTDLGSEINFKFTLIFLRNSPRYKRNVRINRGYKGKHLTLDLNFKCLLM